MFIMFIIPTPVQISRRHYVFYLLSGRLSSVTKFVNVIFKKNELTYFDANWHDTINFGDQEIKGQGHRRPKLDLEAWRRHHSEPLGRFVF